MNTLKILSLALALTSFPAQSGTVTGGSYLTDAYANQLESWQGLVDQDFTNIYAATVGASASSFHSAVDDQGPTYSIYDITYNGTQMYVGGYTAANWGGNGYFEDNSTFLFNFSSNTALYQNGQNGSIHSIYSAPDFFATFGGGYDLFGGKNELGSNSPYANAWLYGDGAVIGQPGHVINIVSGESLTSYSQNNAIFSVNGLEVYTAANASVVPVPAAVWFMGSGLLGLVGYSRKRSQGTA